MSLRARLPAVVAISASLGCGPQSRPVATDLSAVWSGALVVTEAAEIDIGSDDADGFLRVGWYYDERNSATGETFVWSRGTSSEIEFHLGWLRDLTIVARCRPFEYPGAPRQRVTLELNGEPVSVLELKSGFRDYSVLLSAAAQQVGANRLVARYGRVDSPADVIVSSTDQRELAVAWSGVRFVGADAGPVRVASGEMDLPSGAVIDFHLEVPPDSVFELGGCETDQGQTAQLEISIQGDGDQRPTTTVVECPSDGTTMAFKRGGGLSRIRLAARPKGDVGSSTPRIKAIGGVVRSSGPRLLEVPSPTAPSPAVAAPPNVIIYLVDALRADRLGCYGCARGLSPRLDAFAAEGIVFTDAIAQSSWTKAAVASIFTGYWPRAHGVNGPDDRLPDDLATLPELFKAAGYRTGAVVANAYVGRPFGFARGFDHFEFIEHGRGTSEVLHERLTLWLRSLPDDGRPFLLYVHTIDPHAPYDPPAPFCERFAADVEDPSVGQVETVRGLVLGTVEPSPGLASDLKSLYDAEVAANDSSFGSLLDEIATLGRSDDTVVIFTSDHGESFGEHGSWTHGLDLYQEVLSIPLVVRLAGSAGGGRRVAMPTQHIDLLPSILALSGIAGPGDLPGSALFDATGELGGGGDRTLFAYLDYWGKTGAAAFRDGWKLIKPLSEDFGAGVELFRVGDDPGETVNLDLERPVRSGWLRAQLDAALRVRGTSVATDVDRETREQLKALGYLERAED